MSSLANGVVIIRADFRAGQPLAHPTDWVKFGNLGVVLVALLTGHRSKDFKKRRRNPVPLGGGE